MSSIPHWKTRRLAARALRAFERTQGADPTLAAYVHTLVPAAQAFIVTYDRLRVLSQRRATERAEGLEAVDHLARTVRGWAVQIQALNVIEGFMATVYMDKATVPDDVLADASSFLESVREHLNVNPDSIPFVDDMTTAIEAKLEVARHEWTQAEQARGEYSVAVQANREAELALNPFLVAFRRSLAAILGTRSAEYQALRARRVSRQDVEEGPVAEAVEDAAVVEIDAANEATVSNDKGEVLAS